MDARTVLNEYKQKGERVDEVLFHIVINEIDELQAVIAQKNREYDSACEHEMKLIKENQQLRALQQKQEPIPAQR